MEPNTIDCIVNHGNLSPIDNSEYFAKRAIYMYSCDREKMAIGETRLEEHGYIYIIKRKLSSEIFVIESYSNQTGALLEKRFEKRVNNDAGCSVWKRYKVR